MFTIVPVKNGGLFNFLCSMLNMVSRSIDILNGVFCLQHLYVSLSEIQIKREEELTRNPLSKVQ